MTKFLVFAKECFRSRVGWLLVALHASWFLLAIANMSPPSPEFAKFLDQGGWSSASILAGRPFHYHYESLPLKVLFLVDLPSLFAAIPVGLVSAPFYKLLHLGRYEGSYLGAAILLLLGSVQWLVAGNLVQAWLGGRQWGVSTVQRVNRHFVTLTVLVILFTAISAPIVNARSRRLGFRHAAISFH